MDLKEDGLVNPGEHWYYRTKSAAIEAIIARYAPGAESLLDVGAGSGFFARTLVSSNHLALKRATCVDPNYVEDWNEHALAFQRSLPDQPADIVLLLDVLEHVEDDAELLADSCQRLGSGGVIVITVPAFMALWSSHDDYLEHYRRYRLAEVLDLAEASGLKVLHSRYLFGALFPIAFLVRRVFGSVRPGRQSDLRPTHPIVDRILAGWFRFEHAVLRQRMVGLTAVVVGRKP